MTDLVAAKKAERIVGVARSRHAHYARAVSAEKLVYILHSFDCLERGRDLRKCEYSLALDKGIDLTRWTEDVAVLVHIVDGELLPEESP